MTMLELKIENKGVLENLEIDSGNCRVWIHSQTRT